jgi:hypothetical protein
VPHHDLAQLARTCADGVAMLTCRAPSLGVAVPDRGKGLTPVEPSVRATSSLLIESPSEGVEVGMVNARGARKFSIEPCRSFRHRNVDRIPGCNM